MTNRKCDTCGNSYHWSEAFAKFGYDDGNGRIETPYIAQALINAGYSVKYSRWSPHNTLIYSITKDGKEYMPSEYSDYRIGYDNPREYLPADIIAVLEKDFPPVILFS